MAFFKTAKEKNPIDYSDRFWVKANFAMVLLFLYLPLLSVIFYSFNDSRRVSVWQGFTWGNYAKVWENSSLLEGFVNSLLIAFFSAILSLVLGLLAACALRLFAFRGQKIYTGLMAIPIVIPEICMAIALLIFYNSVFGSINVALPWPLNLSLVVFSHVTFCFPFATMIIEARLSLMNKEWLEAAADLGASNFQTMKDIILPYLRPALLSAFLLSFTLSLDDFVITFFTTGPDTITLPVKIYSMLRFSVSPEVNAASTLLIVITLSVTLIATYFQKGAFLKSYE